ncbi:hypothetical protein Tco_1286966 [Tanacetum coccineum]
MILRKKLGFFKELYRRDVDNAMVVLHKDNDLSEEAVKDNEALKEKDDVPEKGNDVEKETSKEKDVEKVVDQNLDKTEAVKDNKVSNEIYDVHEKGKDVEKVVDQNLDKTEAVKDNKVSNEIYDVHEKGKDVEKVVDQDLDKHEDIKKEREIRNNEVEKKIEDLIKGAGADVRVEISKKGASKGVLAIYEENHEPVKKVNFPLIGLEDIESLKGAERNLFGEKTTVQHVNEDDMILQDSLLNLSFLSTQEVSCLEIDTQKSPQIQKQGLQEEPPQIQKQGIPKSFPSNKLKLPKYVSPDAQAIVEKRQEDMLTETRIFRGKETTTFDSIKLKLVKNNDGIARCMKEKSIDEEKGKSNDFKGGHPTVKRQQIKKSNGGREKCSKDAC